MSVGESHAHVRESFESISAYSSASASACSSLCLFTNPRFVLFLSLLLLIYAIVAASSS